MQFDSSFALMLSLFACIPLFIDVSGVAVSVVASMRATACPHSVTECYASFLRCYCLIYRVLISEVSTINGCHFSH
ncbi:hypothetical protein IMSAGC001_01451 [Bacteroides acidifaciens]|uniref:Uncharacterized protein n=1 Tax=Bacteroides acidifaciens TaxID=85831 RepID=A0A7J0A198_9BACE|nr:hypothetical protein IMSAGC001_01451 [Bacteroides acidifaciens]